VHACLRTCAGGGWRGGDAADPGERESAVAVDGDAVRVCGAGEEVAEADRVGADQAGQLGAARLVGALRGAPLLHEREAPRHVEQRVHARRVHPAAGCDDEATVTSSIDAATKTVAGIGDARRRCAATMAGCVEIDVGCGVFVRRAVGMRERRANAEVAYERALRRGARPSRSD
jgi:hypothetical protein